ncbi:hypothetical protein [Calidifontibacter terrae]
MKKFGPGSATTATVLVLALSGCAPTVTVTSATSGASRTSVTGAARPAAAATESSSSAAWKQDFSDAGLDDIVNSAGSGFTVVADSHFVVAGDVDSAHLREVLKVAAQRDASIQAFCGSRPKGRQVILVSKDVSQFAAWTLSDVPDVEGSDGVTVPSTRFERTYVVLAPDLWGSDVETDYRDYVVIHELMHAYTDPRPDVTTWVVEGFAELGAMDLTDQDWRSEPPSSAHLPADKEFDSSDPDKVADAYFLASDFLQFLEMKYTRAEVRTFYRSALTTGIDDAFKKAFGVSLSGEVANWKADYADTFG